MRVGIRFYFGFLLCALLPILFGCSKEYATPKSPKAIKGVIDLRDWDFNNFGPVNLDGEWEFYWNEFLYSGDFKTTQNFKVRYINVPSIWNAEHWDGESLPKYGFGTYKLTVIINDRDEIYAVKTREILSAFKVLIDGKEVFQCGKPGKNKEDSIPKFKTQVSAFYMDHNKFDIIIQVSNFHYKDGGLRDTIKLGFISQINEEREWALVSNYTFFGSVLIMAIYHFGLFGLRREDKSTLLFGLFCLVMASRILVTNEIYLVSIFPDISWALRLKIIVFGYYVGLPIFTIYIYILYPEEYNRLVVGFIMIVGISFSALVLLSKPAIFIETEFFYQIFILISSIYIIYGLSRAVIRRRNGATLAIIGILVLFATVINDVFYAQYVIYFMNYQSLLPFGLFVFIFVQSYILSVRFSNAFRIANIDELSQVFNRRRFVELAEQEIQRSERNKKTLSLFSIDADHFKSINDTYGHDIGDIVLKTLAETIKGNIRKLDIFGRIGGEEFALLLPETDLHRAVQIADRLRQIIEKNTIPIPGDSIFITVSIGVAAIDDLEVVSLERLFKNADIALYQAKNNGRNQVAAWRGNDET